MYEFPTTLTWKPGTEELQLQCKNRPDLNVSSPPEFGGRPDLWSPEDLLCGAVNSCLLLTALYFVGKMQIGLKGYTSTASAAMLKTPNGLRFQHINVTVRAEVATAEDAEKMKKAMEMAEKFCPVSAAVSAPTRVTLESVVAGG